VTTLILGGNGFIGSHLIDRLAKDRHSIRVLDKYAEKYRAPLKNVEYIFEDFQNRGILREALNGVDIVYHLVNTTTPKTSNDDPEFDVQSNVISTLYLLDQCVQQSIKKIIFISSGGAVYGVPDVLPIAENHTLDPISSYGITKLSIEKYLHLYHRLYGMEYTIIRPSNPYGERQNPEGIQGVISIFLGRLFKNEPVEIWGDGHIVRDFIYIKDLVDGIARAAFVQTTNCIFNMGSGVGYSLNDIISIIESVVGKKIQVDHKAGRAFDVPEIYLDITRAQKELDWVPRIEIQEGILRTWKFIQNLHSASREIQSVEKEN
jgi:UDP-glucose 4-epimerase